MRILALCLAVLALPATAQEHRLCLGQRGFRSRSRDLRGDRRARLRRPKSTRQAFPIY